MPVPKTAEKVAQKPSENVTTPPVPAVPKTYTEEQMKALLARAETAEGRAAQAEELAEMDEEQRSKLIDSWGNKNKIIKAVINRYPNLSDRAKKAIARAESPEEAEELAQEFSVAAAPKPGSSVEDALRAAGARTEATAAAEAVISPSPAAAALPVGQTDEEQFKAYGDNGNDDHAAAVKYLQKKGINLASYLT